MKGECGMNGLGYVPVCSSSCCSKTAILSLHGATALFFCLRCRPVYWQIECADRSRIRYRRIPGWSANGKIIHYLLFCRSRSAENTDQHFNAGNGNHYVAL